MAKWKSGWIKRHAEAAGLIDGDFYERTKDSTIECRRCKRMLPTELFHKKLANGSRGYAYACKACEREMTVSRALKPKRPAVPKACSKCGMTKPPSGFYKCVGGKDGLATICKECVFLRSQDRYLMDKYGITSEQYNAMLKEQGGVCWICRSEEREFPFRRGESRRLVVDHCHETGVVRGLLCSLCNTAIGGLKHDPTIVARAAEYLNRSFAHV